MNHLHLVLNVIRMRGIEFKLLIDVVAEEWGIIDQLESECVDKSLRGTHECCICNIVLLVDIIRAPRCKIPRAVGVLYS